LELRRYGDALDGFLLVGERKDAQGALSPAGQHWQVGTIRSLVALERRAEAANLSDADLERSQRWQEPLALARSFAARSLVDPSGALEHLREADRSCADAEAPLERADVRAQLGAALRRSGRTGEARAVLREAVATASRLGATRLVRTWTAELAATGERRSRVRNVARPTLTPSEARIAELARQGLGNQEIARVLHLNVKTVEMHLSSVYRKLAIRNRRELAAVEIDQGRSL
jgi:DNA-binding CsgD family transcriptional regulator